MTPLLSCQSLTKSFGARPLFIDITFGILPGERMGLIGPNGAGKSTLLQIVAGLDKADSGDISRQRNLKQAYVPQNDDLPKEQTVECVLLEALQGETLEEYERAARLHQIMAQIGFSDGEAVVGTLSGGWRKRLALGRALIQRPDLLLLDEPTNHLDLEGVLWLESLLKAAPFAFVVVSHDRYFLENIANRIVELNRAYPEGYLSAAGAYSDFLIKKDEFLSAQAHQQHALEGQVKREVDWLRRGPQARTTKAKARIDQAGRLIDELAEVKYRNAQDRAVEIDFSATRRATKELLVVRNVSKRMGDRTLFSGLDFVLMPGVKLGLLGPNGSGKTTLLRLLMNEIAPDTGLLKRAEGLRVVYFDQNRAPLERNISLRKALCPNGESVVYQGSSIHIASWARRFLFKPEQLDQPVGSLSGGEQARILLANLMLQPADLLILDEPTNDLDIPSLEVLEQSLTEFAGAIVLVTHDRFMLDTVSSELLALDGKGGAAFFADYAQWEMNRPQPEAAFKFGKNARAAAPAVAPVRGLSTAERRELNGMEAAIMALESEIETKQASLTNPAIASNHVKLQTAWKEIEVLRAKVTGLYTRWEALEARNGA